jgi:hypothetical protein
MHATSAKYGINRDISILDQWMRSRWLFVLGEDVIPSGAG